MKKAACAAFERRISHQLRLVSPNLLRWHVQIVTGISRIRRLFSQHITQIAIGNMWVGWRGYAVQMVHFRAYREEGNGTGRGECP